MQIHPIPVIRATLTAAFIIATALTWACGNDEPPIEPLELIPRPTPTQAASVQLPGPTAELPIATPQAQTAPVSTPTPRATPTASVTRTPAPLFQISTHTPVVVPTAAATPLVIPETPQPTYSDPGQEPFPTPNLPSGIGNPPLPPTLPADPANWPTATPRPTPTPKFTTQPGNPMHETAWYQDGLTPTEHEAVALFNRLAGPYPGITLREWVTMPAFETIEAKDLNALRVLDKFKRENPSVYWSTMFSKTLRPGIYEPWTDVVAALPGAISEGGQTAQEQQIITTMLDPKKVTVEIREIQLGLTGLTRLAIVRTKAGVKPSMDRLESAVRAAEVATGQALPNPHIVLLFGDWPLDSPVSGQHHHTNITIAAKYDVGYGDPAADYASELMRKLVNGYYITPDPVPTITPQPSPSPSPTTPAPSTPTPTNTTTEDG